VATISTYTTISIHPSTRERVKEIKEKHGCNVDQAVRITIAAYDVINSSSSGAEFSKTVKEALA